MENLSTNKKLYNYVDNIQQILMENQKLKLNKTKNTMRESISKNNSNNTIPKNEYLNVIPNNSFNKMQINKEEFLRELRNLFDEKKIELNKLLSNKERIINNKIKQFSNRYSNFNKKDVIKNNINLELDNNLYKELRRINNDLENYNTLHNEIKNNKIDFEDYMHQLNNVKRFPKMVVVIKKKNLF